MTQDTLGAIASFVKDYGLPLTILAIFVALILSERLVTGRRYRAMEALFERERADRVATQALVSDFALSNAALAKSVEEAISVVFSARATGLYADRLSGKRQTRP